MPDENRFWDFSVALYGRDAVAPACLRLQDQFGVDVNVVMYCCWVAHAYGIRFDAGDLAQVERIAKPWKSSVVAPLRAIRRDLKTATHEGFDPREQERLRSEIKRLELRAERLQQDALFAAAPKATANPVQASREAALHNVGLYLASLPATTEPSAGADVAIIIGAAFDGK